MRKVKFTQKFANKEKGETGEYDGALANQLVRIDKVAKYVIQKEVKAAQVIEEEIDVVKNEAKAKIKAPKKTISIKDKAKNLFKNDKK